MRVITCVFLSVVLGSCGYQNSAVSDYIPSSTSATESPSPTPELDYLAVPKINVKPLQKQQKKELDATLPSKVRDILEKADVLDVLGLSSDEKAGIGWYPDIKASLPLGEERSNLLKAFYFDASAGPNPSACFIPRHSLKASYKGKTVEVIICYQCHLFVVEGDLGEFDGGVYKQGSAAHELLETILRTKGEPIK